MSKASELHKALAIYKRIDRGERVAGWSASEASHGRFYVMHDDKVVATVTRNPNGLLTILAN